jgi:hypothetical protein
MVVRPITADSILNLRSKIDLYSIWMRPSPQYKSEEEARGETLDRDMYRSFDQDMYHMQGSGKRIGFGGACTVPTQPTFAGMPYMQFGEQPLLTDLYHQSTQSQDITFNVVNEMSQHVYATEVPQFAELVYLSDLQHANWGLEQAPPLLRRPHSSKQDPVPDSRNRSNRERASRPSEPDVLIKEVPKEKIVEVVKEVVKIVEVIKEVQVVKDHYIFKEVPVDKVIIHLALLWLLCN